MKASPLLEEWYRENGYPGGCGRVIRFYDPELGRFLTQDPLTGGPDDPSISYKNGLYFVVERIVKDYLNSNEPWRRSNRYVYCHDNPINFIDPLGLYDEDVHLDLREVLAEAAGLSPEDAQTVARADQMVDVNRDTHPILGGEQAREKYHFTTEQRRTEMYQEAVRGKSMEKFGQFSHANEDSFSHQKGQTDRVPGKEYSPERGHAFDSKFRGIPVDKTSYRPELADKMAISSFDKTVEFKKDIQYKDDFKVDYKNIEKNVEQFNRAATDEAKKQAVEMIRQEIAKEREHQEIEKAKAAKETQDIKAPEKVEERKDLPTF